MIFLYYGQFEHWSYCENWIADAIDRSGHHCLRIRRTPWFDELRLITIARQNGATHLLLSKTPEIHPDQLVAIKQAGLKVVFWTFDWMRHPDAWQWYGPLSKVADACFQTDGYGDAEFYKSEGVNRIELHQGYVPGLHEIPNMLRDSSNGGGLVTFIGSEYTERRHELCRVIKESYPLSKYGEPGPQVWGDAFARAVYFSSVVVGDNFVNDVPGYWSDRVYLTLACGGFFLTAYVEGLENRFTNHQHLVWWKSFDELLDMIRFYLPRENHRKAIALNGYQSVHKLDSYDARVQKMMTELEQL